MPLSPYDPLTVNACERLLQGRLIEANGSRLQPVVQVLAVQYDTPNDAPACYRLVLSDGVHFTFANVAEIISGSAQIKELSVISIVQVGKLDQKTSPLKRDVSVVQWKLVDQAQVVYGTPTWICQTLLLRDKWSFFVSIDHFKLDLMPWTQDLKTIRARVKALYPGRDETRLSLEDETDSIEAEIPTQTGRSDYFEAGEMYFLSRLQLEGGAISSKVLFTRKTQVMKCTEASGMSKAPLSPPNFGARRNGSAADSDSDEDQRADRRPWIADILNGSNGKADVLPLARSWEPESLERIIAWPSDLSVPAFWKGKLVSRGIGATSGVQNGTLNTAGAAAALTMNGSNPSTQSTIPASTPSAPATAVPPRSTPSVSGSVALSNLASPSTPAPPVFPSTPRQSVTALSPTAASERTMSHMAQASIASNASAASTSFHSFISTTSLAANGSSMLTPVATAPNGSVMSDMPPSMVASDAGASTVIPKKPASQSLPDDVAPSVVRLSTANLAALSPPPMSTNALQISTRSELHPDDSASQPASPIPPHVSLNGPQVSLNGAPYHAVPAPPPQDQYRPQFSRPYIATAVDRQKVLEGVPLAITAHAHDMHIQYESEMFFQIALMYRFDNPVTWMYELRKLLGKEVGERLEFAMLRTKVEALVDAGTLEGDPWP